MSLEPLGFPEVPTSGSWNPSGCSESTSLGLLAARDLLSVSLARFWSLRELHRRICLGVLRSLDALGTPTIGVVESVDALGSPTVGVVESVDALGSPTVGVVGSVDALGSPTLASSSIDVLGSPTLAMSGASTLRVGGPPRTERRRRSSRRRSRKRRSEAGPIFECTPDLGGCRFRDSSPTLEVAGSEGRADHLLAEHAARLAEGHARRVAAAVSGRTSRTISDVGSSRARRGARCGARASRARRS